MRASLVASRIVLLVSGMAIAPAVGAHERAAHYVSVDDLRLQQAGFITPIHEYLEITTDPTGTLRIEAGYQHMGTSAHTMLQILTAELDYLPDAGPEVFGRLDIPRLRRVAMTGKLVVEPGTLTWAAETLTPTIIEPGFEVRAGNPRLSPFQISDTPVTLRREGGNDTDLGDRFSVIVDGHLHAYRRMDARLLPLAGFLAWMTESSVAQTQGCFLPIADAYLQGETYVFSEAALAELRETAADTPGFAILEERGFGVALTHFLDAALAASEALSGWIAAEVEAIGIEAAIAALDFDTSTDTEATVAWGHALQARLIMTERLHILPGDPEWPAAGEQPDIPALYELVTARYEADPWSVTSPMASALAHQGWVSVLFILLYAECS